MPRAVRFDDYGSVDHLYLAEVDEPEAATGRVVVRVVAASINPGEIAIREGGMREQAPSTFPSGQGSDLAGRVHAVGPDVSGWVVGDEVFGWSEERSAQADLVSVPAGQLIAKPTGVPWEQAASLYVAGGTAHGAVDAVAPVEGETVLVSSAAGGVGSVVVQLLRRRGVRVLGVAGAGNADWLRGLGVEPLTYGEGLADRVRAAAPHGVDAVIDTHGAEYVDLGVELGVDPSRIATIIAFEAAGEVGVQTVFSYQVITTDMLADLARMIAEGELRIPVAATFPLARVRDAYTLLADRHTHGKIVLLLAE